MKPLRVIWAVLLALLISLGSSAPTLISLRQLAISGTPSTTTFLRGDGVWSATGDMLKSAYDANVNGIADNSEALGGTVAAGFPKLATVNTFTGANQFNLPVTFPALFGAYSSTFTQADGALPSEWSRGTTYFATNSTSITVVSNAAKLNITTGADALQYLNTSVVGDGTLQADLTRGSGIEFHYSTSGSGYVLLLDSSGNLQVNKQFSSSTVDTTLYSAGAQANGTYRVVMSGNTYAIYQGSTLLNTITDSSYPTGYLGIYAQPASTNTLDNFSWTPAGSPSGTVQLVNEGGVLRTRNASGVSVTVGEQEAVRSVTAATTLTSSDDILNVSTAAGAFTQPLPSAIGLTGKNLTFKKTDSSTNALTLSTVNSQTIDGASTYVMGSQYTAMQLYSDGANWQIMALVLPGSRLDIYGGPSSSGTFTWNKPPWAKTVHVVVFGQGGGGGSGRRGAAATARSGGSGGSGGSINEATFLASLLPSTVSITVQPGGAGGAAVTTDSTSGNAGATISASLTSFGTYPLSVRVFGGNPGAGGTAAATSGGSALVTAFPGAAGATTSVSAAATSPNAATRASSGGGAGGSLSTGDVILAGSQGAGPPAVVYGSAGPSVGGASGGTTDAAAGMAGTDNSAGLDFGAPGGGGGAASKTSTGGGRGGNGAWPGGGAGGGGASLDATGPSGAGGTGGNGGVFVYSMP